MKRMKGLLFIAAMAFTTLGQAAEEGDILGVWVTKDAKSNVEITKCNSGLCGHIIALKEALYPEGDAMAGQTKTDRNNPDESKQANPIIGLQILTGFVFDGDNVWEDGEIYDPNNGKTYKCKMTLEGNTLKVRGYIGFALLGRTTEWSR
ncbi:MAG: DUF2147 domain-containing protein [Gammaproteobacteria bacterium]|nr:DUF2147 domain-containing protein [Gammaproteobacteria bacterium]